MTPNVFSIFRGDDKTMYLRVVNSGCSPNPLDLTSCTEIDVKLPNEDGTFSHLKLTQGKVAITSPAVLGQFSVTIAAAVSNLLNIGELQSFIVSFTISAKVFSVKFQNALSVFES